MACALGQRLKSVVAFLSSVFVLGLRSKGDKVPLRAPTCAASQLWSLPHVQLLSLRPPQSSVCSSQLLRRAQPLSDPPVCARTVHARGAFDFLSQLQLREIFSTTLSIEWDFGGSGSCT